MKEVISRGAQNFLNLSKDSKVLVVSHFDTDGVTSASIICKAFKRANINFSMKIVKSLRDDFVLSLPKDRIIVFSDLGSGSLELFSDLLKVFVIDHHEIKTKPLPNTVLINPHLLPDSEYEDICSAGIAYLFSKALSPDGSNKDLASLAIIGMVGDLVKTIGPYNNEILTDADVIIKKGLQIYPATRPLNKSLEYSSRMIIPGVTGDIKGVLKLLRESGITKVDGKFKSLIDLDEEENSRLITGVILRRRGLDNSRLIDNIYLVKFFGKLEDAREISAKINACSRLGRSDIALSFCVGSKKARKDSEDIYADYKQMLVSALRFVDTSKDSKIVGNDYVIINAKDQIRDTIIGTVTSILSFSSKYKEGTAILGMSYNESGIKVSLRIVGNNGRKAHKIIGGVMKNFSGEWGGHDNAAGCTISRDDEVKFLESVKHSLEYSELKV